MGDNHHHQHCLNYKAQFVTVSCSSIGMLFELAEVLEFGRVAALSEVSVDNFIS